jgi:hypothetical protein
MRSHIRHKRCTALLLTPGPTAILTAIAAFVLAFGLVAHAQQPGPPPMSSAPSPQSAPPPAPRAKPGQEPKVHAITEEQLKPQFVGKTLYLRGEYLDDRLHFDEQGNLMGSASKASYTLAIVQIDKIHLSKHKFDLQGIRFGLHFIGSGPVEDPLHPSDMVRLTPQKKVVRVTIDRAPVVKPGKRSKYADASPESPVSHTQAQANAMLRQAIDTVFSSAMDERMIASLPEFWQLYFKAAASKSGYRPHDPSVLRQNSVDQKARLIASSAPLSNDFAQAAGVAGLAMFHVVVAPDGKPAEIAVGRPIGFGLDENAVDSIRKASFQPALKGGKPVPVLVDLVVEFRIFSKRTGVSGEATATIAQPEGAPTPGPYSVNEPAPKQP